jgi:long-chain fatty acid transport protein
MTMSKNFRRAASAFAVLTATACLAGLGATTAHATNGNVQHGFGMGSKAMAGVGAALPQDTSGVMLNPAGMVFLGNRFDVGVAAFNPNRKTTATGGGTITDGTYKSDEELFLIPEIGINYMWDETTALSFTVTPSGGMNTEYATNPFDTFNAGHDTTPAGVDLSQMFVSATLSKKIGNHAFGISPVFAAQKFKAYGLQAFTGVSVDSRHVTDNGYDHSIGGGFRVGYLGEWYDGLTVGASYQSRMYMSKFTKYKGLFAEGGDFDVPAMATAGVAYKVPESKLTVGFDWQWILYRDVAAIGNDGVMSLNSLATAGDGRLGGTNHAPGFGWNDMHVFKLGAKYDYSPELTLRAGASYNTGAYTDHDMLFNILAPATIQVHLTMGATYQVAENHSVNFAYMHGLSNDVTGTHVSNGAGTIEHNMYQHEAFISYSYNW